MGLKSLLLSRDPQVIQVLRPTLNKIRAPAGITQSAVKKTTQKNSATFLISVLNVRTHSLTASFGFIGLLYVAAGSLIVNLKIRDPLATSRGPKPLEK